MGTSFEAVWNRVTGIQPKDEGLQLLGFYSDELVSAGEYRRMALRTGSGQAKKLFLSLAAEEQKHANRLRTAAYILKGAEQEGIPALPETGCEKPLSAIRKQYEKECVRAKAYAAAAAEVESEQLKLLYADLARQEKAHCSTLWALIRKMM